MTQIRHLNKVERKVRILETGKELLIQGGIGAVTLNAVGSRLGCSHANIAHNVGSIAQFRIDLARHVCERACAMIRKAISCDNPTYISSAVALIFDIFQNQGGLWLVEGNAIGDDDNLPKFIDTVHELISSIDDIGLDLSRYVTKWLIIHASGNAMLGEKLDRSLHLSRSDAQVTTEAWLSGQMGRRSIGHRQAFGSRQHAGQAAEDVSQTTWSWMELQPGAVG